MGSPLGAVLGACRFSTYLAIASVHCTFRHVIMCCIRSEHYPAFRESDGNSCKDVEFADIGCGFGGLLIRLATVYPDKLMLGMEIRDKVCHSAETFAHLKNDRQHYKKDRIWAKVVPCLAFVHCSSDCSN